MICLCYFNRSIMNVGGGGGGGGGRSSSLLHSAKVLIYPRHRAGGERLLKLTMFRP